jgi:hypothetical protein
MPDADVFRVLAQRPGVTNKILHLHREDAPTSYPRAQGTMGHDAPPELRVVITLLAGRRIIAAIIRGTHRSRR